MTVKHYDNLLNLSYIYNIDYMLYRTYLLIAEIFVSLLLIIAILSQKSEGSAFSANSNFKARGAKSIMNSVISILFIIFVIISINLAIHVKNEAQMHKISISQDD